MYVWIWRRLPGGRPGKVVLSTLLVAVVVLVLFFVVFPRVERLLPYQDVTVTNPGGATPAPSAGP